MSDTDVPTTDETALEPDEEVDEFDQEIIDLGAPPGMGASAADSDRYSMEVLDIERRRMEALQEALDSGEVIPSEDTSGNREDVVILDPPTAPEGGNALTSGGTGTGQADGT